MIHLEAYFDLPKVGIDVAKSTFNTTVLINKEPHKKFSNKPKGFQELAAWLRKHGVEKAWICMEPTNKYWRELAKFLVAEGHFVSLVNPYTFSSYASGQRRAKGDRKDSYLLGTYCRDWKPRLWQPPSPDQEKLVEISRARAFLKKQLQAAENHLSTLEFSAVTDCLQRHILALQEQVSELDKAEEQAIESSELGEERGRWLRVLGIGKETANAVLADIGSLSRFDRYITVRRLAGMDSVRNQSGTSVNGKAHTSKRGIRRVRANLHMAAMSAMQSNPRFCAFAEHLRNRGKLDCVVVTAVANKLLMTMWALSRYQSEFDPNHRPEWLKQPAA